MEGNMRGKRSRGVQPRGGVRDKHFDDPTEALASSYIVQAGSKRIPEVASASPAADATAAVSRGIHTSFKRSDSESEEPLVENPIMHREREEEEASPAPKRARPSYPYGNYPQYYGYRLGPILIEDPRIQV